MTRAHQSLRAGTVKRTSRKHLQALEVSQSTGESRYSGFPRGVSPHMRFLSYFDNNEVQIAVGHHSNPNSKVRSYDLDRICINCSGVAGIYAGILPLSHFPNFIVAAKIVINNACERYHDGETGTSISTSLRIFQQICSWMVGLGIYRLQDLRSDQLGSLIKELSNRSWRKVLHYSRHIAQLIIDVQSTPELARKLQSRANVAAGCLCVTAIEQHIGVPLHPSYIPNRLRRAIAKTCGTPLPAPMAYYPPAPSPSELKHTMEVLNSLAILPEGIDGIPFRPFPNPHRVKSSLLPAHAPKVSSPLNTFRRRALSAGQTPNISPADYALAFEICIKYVIDYGPEVCDLMEMARSGVLAVRPTSYSDDMKALSKKITAAATLKINDGKLPTLSINSLRGKNSFLDLVKLTMTAACTLITINHARRMNEIVGFGKPYGLYFGCLQELRYFPPHHQLDMYIEKGIQDFRSFPANTLVRDSVLLLERMHILMRASDESIPVYFTPREAGRHRKLLSFREFNPGGLRIEAASFRLRPYLARLLSEVGIDVSAWDGQQMPFRRAFTTLFTRRYDLVEYPAVQAQLGHLSLGTTIPYQLDKVERPKGMSVAELHGRDVVNSEEVAIVHALAESRSEYLVDGIKRLFEGHFVGGKFASLVLALVKRLSANTDFKELNLQRKAERVAPILLKRGYQPEAMRHTVCMAGGAPRTKAGSNCYRDGSLHRSDASAEKCNHCIHSWSNENYLKALEDDLAECEAGISAENGDSALNSEYRAAAERIKKLLILERELADVNRRKLASLLHSWQAMIFQIRTKQ